MFSIASPNNSFVDFNPAASYTLEQPDISLPAYNDFGIRFQFKVLGDLLASAPLKVVICNSAGVKFLDQGVFAQPLCFQYRITATEAMFPLTVNAGQAIPAGAYADLPTFLLAIQAAIGVPVANTTFDFCCLLPMLSIATSGPTITMDKWWDYGFVNYPAVIMGGLIPTGTCYRYGIADGSGNVLVYSNKFQRVPNTAFSTLLKYWNDSDAFDFDYPTADFFNTIRLPFSFRKPVYPIIEQTYIKSTGDIKRISSRIMKEYEGYTDILTEYFHERLIVALKHDHVQFTNTDVGLVAKEIVITGDYKPDWSDENTVVVAAAKFKIAVPISDINSNCFSTVTIPCCPPILLSVTSDNTSITINFDYGNFTTAINFRYRISGTMAWTTLPNILGKSYTINDLTSGTDIEFQFQSVCGASISGWSHSYTQTTTGSPVVSCTGSISGLSFVQTGDGIGIVSFTAAGTATQWKYSIDGVAAGTVSTPSIGLIGLSVGNHAIIITPVCTNGALGTPATINITVAAEPSITEISNGDSGFLGQRTQVFQIGASVSPGNRFTLQAYFHTLSVTAVSGDTPTSIASKLASLVNITTEAQWSDHSDTPPSGTSGYPPFASNTGAQLTIHLNSSNEFFAGAYIS